MKRPSREADEKLYAAWAQFSLTNDVKDFHIYIDLLITTLNDGQQLTGNGSGPQPTLPSGFLRSISQRLRDIDLRIQMPANLADNSNVLQQHAPFLLKVLDALVSISRNNDFVSQLSNASALNGAILSLMQKTIDFISEKSTDEKLIQIVVICCTYFERLYDPSFRWRRKLDHTELYQHATRSNLSTKANGDVATESSDCNICNYDIDTVGAAGGDAAKNLCPHHRQPRRSFYSYPSTIAAKPGQLSPEVLPLLHEMLMKIPNLFDESILSRATYERITTCAVHLLGAILYGSIYNALQVATPAVLDALLWLMKHRLKLGKVRDDEIIVIDLLCLVRMVHVLHGAPSADLRQLEVDAHIEEYFRFISDLPHNDVGSHTLKQMLLDHITVILNCPNRHSLQRIMLVDCSAFTIIKIELCRFSSNLSLPSNNPSHELSLLSVESFNSNQLSSNLCSTDRNSAHFSRGFSTEDYNSSQFSLARLIRVLTHLMQHSTNAKEHFDVQIGFPFLLTLLLKLKPLSDEVVNAVVDMVFDSSDDQKLRRLENPKAAALLIGLLPFITNKSQQLWTVQQIYHHAQSSIVCRTHFVENDMLSTVLSTLDQNLTQSRTLPGSVISLLQRFAILLAEFSLSSSELWHILHGLHKAAKKAQTVDHADDIATSHAHFLLKCLKKVSSSSSSPSVSKYFDISREFDGIFIDSFGKSLSSNNGFVFHCWLCLEKFQPQNSAQKSRRTLFCFTDPSGAGFEAFFSCPDDELFIVYRTKQKFLVTPVKINNLTVPLSPNSSKQNATTLCDGRWHSLTVSYNMAASVSTLRKGSNKLLGLTSSIASAVMGPSLLVNAANTATTVNVFVDGHSTGELVVMVQSNQSKMPETFSRCIIGAAAATPTTSHVTDTVDAKRDNKAATTSYESQVISIPLGTEDDIWGTPVALYGMLGSVCVFPEVFSSILIKSLHDAGPNARGLSRNVLDMLQSSNRFYLHFSPYACEQSSAELGIHPDVGQKNLFELGSGDSSVAAVFAANCVNLANTDVGHAKFIGRVVRLDSIYGSITKIGGVSCLVPLIETCDVLVNDKNRNTTVNQLKESDKSDSITLVETEDDNASYEGDANTKKKVGKNHDGNSMYSEGLDESYEAEHPIACFFAILRNILQNRAAEDSVDEPTGIFATVAVLLADMKANNKMFSVDVLFAVQILAEFLLFESATHPNPLCADFLRYILFNFDLWSKMADFTVQIGHVQFLRKIMRDQKKMFCRQYGFGLQFLLDVIRRYYLPQNLSAARASSKPSDVNFDVTQIKQVDAETNPDAIQVNPALNSDDAKAIRISIFSIIRDVVSRDTRADDVRALIAFMLTVVNSAADVVEELIDLCINMMQSDNSRNLSDQFLLHMFEQDNAELLFYIVTLKPNESNHNRHNATSRLLDSNQTENNTASTEFDANHDSKSTDSINRLSIVKQKVLHFIDLLLATPKVYEKSKITLRLDDAGGLMGLMMFFNNTELSECMLLMFVNQLLQFHDSKTELESENCYAHLLALTNKLHYVTSVETKLEIARRFLTSLFMRPRAAHQLSKISGWCLSLLGLLVYEPIRASSVAVRRPETPNLISFESMDKNADSISLTSTSSSVIELAPLQITDDDDDSTTTALEPFEVVEENSPSLTSSLLTTQLGSRSLLTLPITRDLSQIEPTFTLKPSNSGQALPSSCDSPRNSYQDSTILTELIAIVVNIIFTSIWKGVDGFDRFAWLKRAQAFTSIDVMALSNILYTDRQCLKRSVLEMLLTAVTMDVQNSTTPSPNIEPTAILENSLSVLKLCCDFCCYGNLLDIKTNSAEIPKKIQNFLEKYLNLCEIIVNLPKSPAKAKVVDRLDLVSMHRAVLLQCLSSESLDLVEFGSNRLHAIITASSSSPNMGVAGLRIKEAEEAAFLLYEINQRVVLDMEMGANWARYEICAKLWKNLLRHCGALLNAEHYLFKVPLSESDEEFLEKLKSYLLLATPTTTPTSTTGTSEWKAFMKCIVETLHAKFKTKYIDKRRERMSTFWNECYESTVEGLHMRNRQFGEAKLRCQVRIMRRAMRRQRDEQKRFALIFKQHADDYDVIRRRWQRHTSSFIKSGRGPWADKAAVDDIFGYELKPYENTLRIRPCVDKCWNFDRNLFEEAAQLRDNTHPSSNQNILSNIDQQLLLKQAKAKKAEKFDEADEDWDVIISAAAADREMTIDDGHAPEPVEQDTEEFLSSLFSSPSQVPSSTNKLILREFCTRVTPAYVVDGIFRLTSHAIVFTPTTIKQTGVDCAATHVSNKLIPPEEMAIFVRLDTLKEMHLRKYNLRRSAVEFFLTNQTNFFLNFADTSSRNQVCSRVITLKPPNMVYYKARSPAALLKASGITQRWMQREIGNFEYLMALNTIAGRSFNDLAQYPVFPWVIKKFDDVVLDLDDPDTFRDLSRPMGVQNHAHDAEVRAKYEGFDDPETPPFHYGQHYSTPATVIHYLVRLEPFSSLHVALQSGRWDLADRQFYDIASTWRLLFENSNEVKELTPEFFALPEFLTNVNHYNLGRLQGRSTSQVGDVVLPRWARTPEEFIYQHRRALECEFVSARLHHWIDLIFGFKQRGPAAVDALNVFYYCTYEGNVDLDAIEDPVQRRALEGMINNFGQTPSQLLQEPHPRRMSYEEATHRALKASDRSLNLFTNLQHLRLRAYTVDAQGAADDACVFVGLARHDSSSLSAATGNGVALSSLLSPAAAPALVNPRSLFVQATTMATSIVGENTVITVGASGSVGIHAWQPNAPSTNTNTAAAVAAVGAVAPFATSSPVFWEFDVSVRNKSLRNIAGPFHPRLLSSGNNKTAPKSNLFVLTNDGKLLISAGHWDNSIRVFNIYRSKTISHLTQHRDTVTALAIDNFGLHLISGSRDGAVYVWNIAQQPGEIGTATAFGGVHKKPLHFLSGHVDCGVVAVAINTELDTALSTGDDNCIIVSGVEHGDYKRTLRPFDDFVNDEDRRQQVKTGQIDFVCISAQTAHIYVAANRVTFAAAIQSGEDESSDDESLSSILFVYSINGKFLYHRTFSSGGETAQKSDFAITCMKCAPNADYCLVALESVIKVQKGEARSLPKTGHRGTPTRARRSTSFVVSSSSTHNVLYVIEWFKLNIVASVPLVARGLSLEVARGNSHILVGMQNGQVALVTAHFDSKNDAGAINSAAANALSAITDGSNQKSFSRTVNRLINLV